MVNLKSNLIILFCSIHKVVNDLDTFFSDTVKELNCYTEEIKEQSQERTK